MLTLQGTKAAFRMYTKRYLKNMRHKKSSSKRSNFFSLINKHSLKISTFSPLTSKLFFKPSTFSPHKDRPRSKLSDSFTLTGTILTDMQSMVNSFVMKDNQPIIRESQILLARKVEEKISSSERSLVSSILKDMPCQTGKYGVSL